MLTLVLFPIKILLIVIDLLITIITYGWLGAAKQLFMGKPMQTVPVKEDDPSHRIHPDAKDGFLTETIRPGIKTLYDLTVYAVMNYSDKKAMGTREFLGWKTPKKVKHFGDNIDWLTYSEMSEISHKFGAALRAAGCVPAPPTTKLDKVTEPSRMAIFENTCAQWMMAAQGAFSQGITVTTVYATLGMDAVVEAVVDNIIPVILCNAKDVARLVGKIKDMPTLKCIVYTFDTVGPDEEPEIPEAPRGVQIVSFDEFVESGDTTAYKPTPPVPESCAVVMYTSGSTGKPKGVIVEHRQILALVSAATPVFGFEEGQERYLAYLPLAHMLELACEFGILISGGRLCYADPKSLSATGAYPEGALDAYAPTLMPGVPKIWDIIKKGVEGKIAGQSAVAQYLVKTAFEWKLFAIRNGFDTPLFNVLVFSKFKEAVGGCLRMGLSGGGPTSAEVQDFIRVCFGIDLMVGYGLTETCGCVAVQRKDDLRTGVAGCPITSNEVKLESTPDVGDKAGLPYLSTDKFDVDGNPVCGRGEICIKGTNVFAGYYMMPDKTKEAVDEDGWFHTGDIGQFTADGALQVVDRKKNLVKLKGGEYIAIERMEMFYGNSNFVDAVAGGICCYGDGEMDRPVALMQLNQTHTMKWAKQNGVAGDFDSIKNSPDLLSAVLADMKKVHAKSGLSHLEKLVGVALLSSPWTVENGCLTAANKIQRRTIFDKFSKEFEEVKKKGVF